jgi:hypothetical protein
MHAIDQLRIFLLLILRKQAITKEPENLLPIAYILE